MQVRAITCFRHIYRKNFSRSFSSVKVTSFLQDQQPKRVQKIVSSDVEERPDFDISPSHSIEDISLGARPEVGNNEIKDARLLFEMVWRDIVNKVGLENMVFPYQIVFVSGAPGAGKGTMIGYIKRERDIAQSVEMSSLLVTPAFQELKASGALIGDREVLEALLMELIQKKNALGLVVDGFPRTLVQV